LAARVPVRPRAVAEGTGLNVRQQRPGGKPGRKQPKQAAPEEELGSELDNNALGRLVKLPRLLRSRRTGQRGRKIGLKNQRRAAWDPTIRGQLPQGFSIQRLKIRIVRQRRDRLRQQPPHRLRVV